MRQINKLVLIIILLLLCTSCQQNTKKELISLSSYNSLVALNDLSVDISELLNHIEKKEYIKAEEVILNIHETWDSFYPYAYISGLSKDTSTEFINDLSHTSEMIMNHAKRQKLMDIQREEQKALIYIDSLTKEYSSLNPQQTEKTDKEGKTGEDSSDNKQADKNDMEMMDKNKLSYQKSDTFAGMDFPQLKDIILPEEIMLKTYPEIAFNEEDALAYVSAVQLTMHLSNFYEIISEPNEASLIYIKFLLQDIVANAELDKWQQVSKDILTLISSWNNVRQKLGNETEELIIKVEQNIDEIDQLINQQNKEVLKVKCKIAIKNIESLMNK